MRFPARPLVLLFLISSVLPVPALACNNVMVMGSYFLTFLGVLGIVSLTLALPCAVLFWNRRRCRMALSQSRVGMIGSGILTIISMVVLLLIAAFFLLIALEAGFRAYGYLSQMEKCAVIFLNLSLLFFTPALCRRIRRLDQKETRCTLLESLSGAVGIPLLLAFFVMLSFNSVIWTYEGELLAPARASSFF